MRGRVDWPSVQRCRGKRCRTRFRRSVGTRDSISRTTRRISSSVATSWTGQPEARAGAARTDGVITYLGRAMLPTFSILDLLQVSCDPPLTAETLEELQTKLGRRFPQQYAEFLMQFNGGHFVRWVEYSVPHPTKFVH